MSEPEKKAEAAAEHEHAAAAPETTIPEYTDATADATADAAAAPPLDNIASAGHETVENEKARESVEHVEEKGVTMDKHQQAGADYIRQQHTIPTTGARMLTGKWEYIFFCMFCKSSSRILGSNEPKLTAFSRFFQQRRS